MNLGSTRIGTWNLDHVRPQRHDVERLRFMLQADADIWVLTETNDRLALPGYAAVHSAPRRGGQPGGRWVTIWTRLPIRQHVAVDDVQRTVATMVKSARGDLLVFGTVLPWQMDFGDAPTGNKPRAWEEQYRVTPLQGREWARLKAEHPSAALCVAGDLNMNLGGPHYYGTARGRALLGEAMAAAGLACATAYDRVPPDLLKYPAIDHILLPVALAGHARVVAAWEGTTPEGHRLTDHSALVVQVD